MSPMSLGGVALYLPETLDHKFLCQLAHEFQITTNDKSSVLFFGCSINMPNRLPVGGALFWGGLLYRVQNYDSWYSYSAVVNCFRFINCQSH